MAEDFREGRVDEKERLKYCLGMFAACNIAACCGGASSIEDLISTALNLTVTAMGTILCYRVNSRGDNKDFVARMICLGWPVGVRVTTAIVAVFFFLSVLQSLPSAALGREAFLLQMPGQIREIWGYFWGIFFLWPFYGGIYSGIARISQTHAVDSAVATPHHVLPQHPTASERKAKREPQETVWDIVGIPLAILGGLGIAVLFVAITIEFADPGLPKRLRMLGAAFPMGLTWLLIWLLRWDRKRRSLARTQNSLV